MEKIQLKKGGTVYNVVETNLKSDDCLDWKETEKAIKCELAINYPEIGDSLVYVWLPKWAVKSTNHKIELWLTEKMEKINVYNVDTKESKEMSQDDFIKAVENY